MKKILVGLVLVFATTAWAQESQIVKVKGMVCAFCAQGIEKTFKAQKEVENIVVSLEEKFIKIDYKEGQKLSPEKISSLLKESGYEAVF